MHKTATALATMTFVLAGTMSASAAPQAVRLSYTADPAACSVLTGSPDRPVERSLSLMRSTTRDLQAVQDAAAELAEVLPLTSGRLRVDVNTLAAGMRGLARVDRFGGTLDTRLFRRAAHRIQRACHVTHARAL